MTSPTKRLLGTLIVLITVWVPHAYRRESMVLSPTTGQIKILESTGMMDCVNSQHIPYRYVLENARAQLLVKMTAGFDSSSPGANFAVDGDSSPTISPQWRDQRVHWNKLADAQGPFH